LSQLFVEAITQNKNYNITLQLRRHGHQTESSSVLQEDRIYPLIEVVAPKRTNASPYNSRADTQALPHEATCRPANRSWTRLEGELGANVEHQCLFPLHQIQIPEACV